MDDLSSGKRVNIPDGVTFIEMDVRDPKIRAQRSPLRPRESSRSTNRRPIVSFDPINDARQSSRTLNIAEAAVEVQCRSYVC